MVEYEVICLPEALEDVNENFDFIAIKSKYAAEKIITSLLNQSNQLKKHPNLGQQEELLKHKGDNFRYLLEGHYKLLYMVLEKQVLILQVFDIFQDTRNLKL